MTITEFARGRDLHVNTVSKYIREHEEFKGHVTPKGKERILDDKAIELLDKKYPLPKPIQLINGVPEEEHFRVMQEKDEQIQKLQSVIIELQAKQSDMLLELGELRGKSLMLEDKQKKIEALEEQLTHVKSRKLWARIFDK